MKELGEVTLMTEWVKAPSVGVVLPLTHLQNLVSFPRYGRLKKKCWYKQICNGTYWLLLTGHFGPVFIRPSQWSIIAVVTYLAFLGSVTYLRWLPPGVSAPCCRLVELQQPADLPPRRLAAAMRLQCSARQCLAADACSSASHHSTLHRAMTCYIMPAS